jgi:uncharacterized membrane protein YccC
LEDCGHLAANLDKLVIDIILHILIPTIVLSPVLWLAGRALTDKQKAKLTDAIWIVLIGTVFGSIFSVFFAGILASLIQLIVWLALIKHFFDCGWLKAFAISIVAVIIFIIIAVVLALLGYGIWNLLTI